MYDNPWPDQQRRLQQDWWESLNIYENKKNAIEGNSYKIVLQENG